MKYDELRCPRCFKTTLHRVRRKYGVSNDGKSFMKYEAKHCLVCNKYWGYSKKKDVVKAPRHISFA